MVSPRTFWVGMIVGLLSLSVGVNLYVLFALAESPADTLEEDWEARSENWNEFQVQHTLNRKLGWRLDLIEDEPAGSAPTAFVLTLKDIERKAILGATITLKASHNAHYGERQLLHATEFEPGQYRIEMQIPYPGTWQFHGQVQLSDATREDPGTLFTQSWTERLERPATQ
jgi:hypothetical protein